MEKRTKLAIVILVGLLLLLLGLYIFLSPILEERRALQPPPLPSSVTPVITPTPKPPTPAPQPTPAAPVTPETNGLKILENRARNVVERIGSGTSENGFLGYQDALLDATSAGQAALKAEQSRMQAAHPANGPLYTISTRAITSNATKGAFGDATIVFTVDAIQTVNGGTASQTTLTKRITVTFAKQSDGSYLVDAAEWSDLAP